MSYHIYLYPVEVKNAALAGVEFEDIHGPKIPPDVVEQFKERLVRYGYVLESTNPVSTEYVHPNAHWSIQVTIYRTEIAFAVPYWDDAENAIFDASMTANELAADVGLFVFDPQSGEWST